MPFFKIPPEKLQHITLFGYEVKSENDDLILAIGPDGKKYIIEKASPWVWMEEIEDAMQLGALGVITPP